MNSSDIFYVILTVHSIAIGGYLFITPTHAQFLQYYYFTPICCCVLRRVSSDVTHSSIYGILHPYGNKRIQDQICH
jgi:hypothetical protein